MNVHTPTKLVITPEATRRVLKFVPRISLDAKSSFRFPRRQNPTATNARPCQTSVLSFENKGQFFWKYPAAREHSESRRKMQTVERITWLRASKKKNCDLLAGRRKGRRGGGGKRGSR